MHGIRIYKKTFWLWAVAVALWILLIAPASMAASEEEAEDDAPVIGRKAELYGIRPEKPVTIKLKRDAKGGYTWEITGDDPDKVTDADTKLRQYINRNSK